MKTKSATAASTRKFVMCTPEMKSNARGVREKASGITSRVSPPGEIQIVFVHEEAYDAGRADVEKLMSLRRNRKPESERTRKPHFKCFPGEVRREYVEKPYIHPVSRTSLSVFVEGVLNPNIIELASRVETVLSGGMVITPEELELLDSFAKAYSGNRIERLECWGPSVGWIVDNEVSDLFVSLLEFVNLCRRNILSVEPRVITLIPDGDGVGVLVDGKRQRLPGSRIKALVAAYKLGWDQWFSVENFSKLATGDVTNDKQNFQRLMSPLRPEVLNWGADNRMRRIVGAQVRNQCTDKQLESVLSKRHS
ncbi:hypothetical protein ACXR0O_24975 [Verrucomicrobiota bacterium sgz303538]